MPSQEQSLTTQADIGNRIREARERLGMSQRDLADAVEKDQRAIYEYETGKRKVPAVELSVFARVLNVPVSFFYDGTIPDDAIEQMILQEVQLLPSPEAKEAALQVLRIFTSLLSKQTNG